MININESNIRIYIRIKLNPDYRLNSKYFYYEIINSLIYINENYKIYKFNYDAKKKYLNYYTEPAIKIIINTINIFNICEIKKIIKPFQVIYKNKIKYLKLRKLLENRNINIIGSIATRFRISNINL